VCTLSNVIPIELNVSKFEKDGSQGQTERNVVLQEEEEI
jgi:hypothetical protein